MCAFVGAVCHWWHTALQPAQWHARGGLGVARACCHGHVCARLPQMLRLAAWPADRRWESLLWETHHCVVEIKSLFTTQHIEPVFVVLPNVIRVDRVQRSNV